MVLLNYVVRIQRDFDEFHSGEKKSARFFLIGVELRGISGEERNLFGRRRKVERKGTSGFGY